MKDPVGVECVFSADGRVQVRRVQIGGQWTAVGQGRQWVDQHGRHALILLSGGEVREVVLRPSTLTWELASRGREAKIV